MLYVNVKKKYICIFINIYLLKYIKHVKYFIKKYELLKDFNKLKNNWFIRMILPQLKCFKARICCKI